MAHSLTALDQAFKAQVESRIRKLDADWGSSTGRYLMLAGTQECLRLAKEHLRGADGGEINGWDDLERELEKL